MQTYKFDIKKEFFIIDSNNLNDVQNKLYGFCLINGCVVEEFKKVEEKQLSGDGAYIYIKREDNQITIRQDFIGSYGLYLYKEEDYFALSNSFIYLFSRSCKA